MTRQASLGELVQHASGRVVDASEVRKETPEVTGAVRELTLEEEEALFDREMEEANTLRDLAKDTKSTWLREANDNAMNLDFTPEARAVATDLNREVEERERRALERWNRVQAQAKEKKKAKAAASAEMETDAGAGLSADVPEGTGAVVSEAETETSVPTQEE